MEKKQEKKQSAVDEAKETKQEAVTSPSEPEQKELEISLLKEQLEAAQAEISSLENLMLRNRADLENTRKRLVRDKDEAVKFANSSLIKDLLEPLDDFGRALDAADSTHDYKKIHDGVLMVNSQIHGILERNWGLERIVALGEEFNPEEHEACMVVEDDSLEVETVLEDLSTGYKLHGRVLRPSKVKVGKPSV
ncbi:nucleotide exchange factor GrpE [Sphaerochaeta sp. PS]|uniref:nucleotide exchange factor GrpE n=1 Tax=Sphaerochaeta sp. PS TaxID=3076336 RepID=UPI0028A3CB30|nr:nucleotide exchange factor GrpE [Sphaerochaeta sp. PS]MDT4760957.1 nucleotide exchange factor GrpE [Sphaerochaeta sp. PS]